MNTPYKNESNNPKLNAQRNLDGRTHYVDDATLRWHKSRIISTYIADDGFILALIESYAVDPDKRTRLYRPCVFDIFGNVIERPTLKNGFRNRKTAHNTLKKILANLDAKQITIDAIARAEKYHAQEMNDLRTKLLTAKAA